MANNFFTEIGGLQPANWVFSEALINATTISQTYNNTNPEDLLSCDNTAYVIDASQTTTGIINMSSRLSIVFDNNGIRPLVDGVSAGSNTVTVRTNNTSNKNIFFFILGNNQASLALCQPSGTENTSRVRTTGNSSDLYNALMEIPLIPYNWTSVPTLQGNNVLTNLSTLNDVNSGEEITTADTTKYNINDNNNVGKIVTKIINSW